MKNIFVLIFIFLSSICSAQQGWIYLNPTPTASPYNDLTMFTETSGICRSTNSIFRTQNGGVNWIEYNFSNSELYTSSLSMVDSSIGYASMASGRLLKTTNGGIDWSFISNLSFGSRKMKFFNSNMGYMLVYDNGRNKIVKTINGGVNWSESFSEDGNVSLTDFHFISAFTGFATGSYPPTQSFLLKLWKTTNAGLTWDSIPSHARLHPNKTFFLNENTGFVCGSVDFIYGDRILRTTNGGVTWGDTLKYTINDIRFADANSGYMLANDTLLGRTTNAGVNWTISKIRNMTINYHIKPTQLYFINPTTAICTGTLGLSLRTTDNGSSWINHNNSFTTDELDDIVFKNNNTGFAMGWSQNIFRTTNAGNSWSKFTMGNSNTKFGAMAYAGGNTWYLSDYYNPMFYKTTNDGATWESSNVGIWGLTSMQFLNVNTGFGVCKYNRFVKTTNGGSTWFINDSLGSQNWTVNFIDENTGYVGGGGWLRKTTNGGISFDTIPRSIIYSAWDVKFISRDTIIVAGQVEGGMNFPWKKTIWKSTNSGVTWTARYLGDGYLSGPLRFSNSNTGYVYAGFGNMHKTTNAGDNWLLIKAPEGNLYGMNFINAETGYMCGDKGIIAKTTDGGASTFINSNETVVKTFCLYQNYPNPFNPSTKIKFDLPLNGSSNIPVKIIIFDILGRKMETLLDENLSAGAHEINWNASRYAAGVYFYMLLTDGIQETKKMILIK